VPIQKGACPILDYDDHPEAVLQPDRILSRQPNMPERVVMPFFQNVIQSVCAGAEIIFHLGSEIGPNPVYRLATEYGTVAVMHPGVGAPLAAAFMEEAIALGGRKFIACGGAGVLKKGIDVEHIVVPDSAIRDEGTSYHYLPPEAEVRAHPDALSAIQRTLARHHLPYEIGRTWTTDAPYRETRDMVNDRIAQGCLTVEMEAAALMAVAQFRGVVFGQLLYGGDDLTGDEWDSREWQGRLTAREKLFWLAIEAVCAI
jgi:uridine phosphorylase